MCFVSLFFFFLMSSCGDGPQPFLCNYMCHSALRLCSGIFSCTGKERGTLLWALRFIGLSSTKLGRCGASRSCPPSSRPMGRPLPFPILPLALVFSSPISHTQRRKTGFLFPPLSLSSIFEFTSRNVGGTGSCLPSPPAWRGGRPFFLIFYFFFPLQAICWQTSDEFSSSLSLLLMKQHKLIPRVSNLPHLSPPKSSRSVYSSEMPEWTFFFFFISQHLRKSPHFCVSLFLSWMPWLDIFCR